MSRRFEVYGSKTKPGRRTSSAGNRLERRKRLQADISSGHCLSPPTGTEEVTMLDPQRGSDLARLRQSLLEGLRDEPVSWVTKTGCSQESHQQKDLRS